MAARIGFTLFLVAGGLVVAGDYFSLPGLTNAGIIVFGLIAILRGAQFLVKGEAIEGREKVSNPNYVQRYKGFTAYLIGAALVLIGLLVLGGGVLGFTTPGGVTAVLSNIIETDRGIALLLGLAGFFVVVFGLVRTISGSATTPGTHNRVVESSIRAGGLLAMLVGLGLLALSLGYFFAPDLLRGWFTQATDFVKGFISG